MPAKGIVKKKYSGRGRAFLPAPCLVARASPARRQPNPRMGLRSIRRPGQMSMTASGQQNACADVAEEARDTGRAPHPLTYGAASLSPNTGATASRERPANYHRDVPRSSARAHRVMPFEKLYPSRDRRR